MFFYGKPQPKTNHTQFDKNLLILKCFFILKHEHKNTQNIKNQIIALKSFSTE